MLNRNLHVKSMSRFTKKFFDFDKSVGLFYKYAEYYSIKYKFISKSNTATELLARVNSITDDQLQYSAAFIRLFWLENIILMGFVLISTTFFQIRHQNKCKGLRILYFFFFFLIVAFFGGGLSV